MEEQSYIEENSNDFQDSIVEKDPNQQSEHNKHIISPRKLLFERKQKFSKKQKEQNQHKKILEVIQQVYPQLYSGVHEEVSKVSETQQALITSVVMNNIYSSYSERKTQFEDLENDDTLDQAICDFISSNNDDKEKLSEEDLKEWNRSFLCEEDLEMPFPFCYDASSNDASSYGGISFLPSSPFCQVY
jgi:hypothetical protein